MAQPWRTQACEVACRIVVIPLAAISYEPGRHPGYVRLDAYPPRTAMLLDSMGSLFDAGAQLDPDEGEVLGESFCDLVRRLMFDQADRAGAGDRRGVNSLFLRKFIDERLDDPDLGPQRVADPADPADALLGNGGGQAPFDPRVAEDAFLGLRDMLAEIDLLAGAGADAVPVGPRPPSWCNFPDGQRA